MSAAQRSGTMSQMLCGSPSIGDQLAVGNAFPHLLVVAGVPDGFRAWHTSSVGHLMRGSSSIHHKVVISPMKRPIYAGSFFAASSRNHSM